MLFYILGRRKGGQKNKIKDLKLENEREKELKTDKIFLMMYAAADCNFNFKNLIFSYFFQI